MPQFAAFMNSKSHYLNLANTLIEGVLLMNRASDAYPLGISQQARG